MKKRVPVNIVIGIGFVLGACVVSCAPVLQMDPLVFQATQTRGGVQIDTLDPESLFQEARESFRDADYPEAARRFELFLKEYPEDLRNLSARYNAGLARERSQEWESALSHFMVYLEGCENPKDVLDGTFRKGLMEKELSRWEEMQATFQSIYHMKLTGIDRAETQALIGLSHEMLGDLALAEREYIAALSIERESDDPSVFQSNEHLSMAQYRIGEIYKRLFDAISFHLPVERMQRDLHDKSTLFLKAQSAYLKAVRRHHHIWALAAGFRTGEIYEDFYNDFIHAEVPTDLDSEDIKIYFEELRVQVRPLLERAIRVYERNLKMGARKRLAHDENTWLGKTEEHLSRLRKLLEAEMERLRKEREEKEHPAS